MVALLLSMLAMGLGSVCVSLELLALNFLHFREFTKMSDARRRGMAPWILSIVACLVGPFAVIMVPVALVWSTFAFLRLKRQPDTEPQLVLARLAILNSAAVLLMMIAFTVWVLVFRYSVQRR